MLERTEAGLRLQGDLTFATVPALVGGIDGLLEAGRPATVDLSAVAGADSAALSLLLEWQRRAQAAGTHLVLSGFPEGLRKLVGLYGLENLIREGA